MARAQAAMAVSSHAQPLAAACGARLEGIDLARLTDSEFRTIEQALLDYHVIALPAQKLTEEQMMGFTSRFAPLEPHVLSEFHHPKYPEILMLSNVQESGKAKGLADAGTYWHSDLSYKARPSWLTALYGIEIPDQGGDTLYCNLVKAYEDLSDEDKTLIAPLRAAHNYAYRSNKLAYELGVRKPLTPEQLAATPEVVHPVVRTHPKSGKKALFINPGFTVRIEGLPEAESQALLQRLFDHCLQPKYQLRYKWHAGDFVIWDNAALMHSATTRELDASKRRTLWRNTVTGTEPF
jgi:taurine dioxygenase